MAFESYFWRKQAKSDIRAVIKRLDIEVSKLEAESLDKLFSEVEIKLFTIAYSLRKLLDTRKLPDRVNNLEISLTSFPRNKKTLMPPWALFDKYYEWNKSQKVRMSLRDLANSFIHAYHFQPFAESSDKLTHLYFSSDRDRNKCIYRVSIKRLLNLFKKAFDQDVVYMSTTYDAKSGNYKTITK